jgi:DNA-directed RNA polymerase specialized sigma24 family protein
MNPADRFAELQAEDAVEGGSVRAIIHHGLSLSPAICDIAADTAELEQEVWMKCWEALAGGEDVDVRWLSVVSKHAASQHRTRAQNEKERTPYSRDDPAAVDHNPTPRPTNKASARYQHLDDLPEIMREFYLDGMRLKEIAKRHVISISAAEKRLQRARDAVREKLVA